VLHVRFSRSFEPAKWATADIDQATVTNRDFMSTGALAAAMSAINSSRKDCQYQGGRGLKEALPDSRMRAPRTDTPIQHYRY
jgi:hypothetical protein